MPSCVTNDVPYGNNKDQTTFTGSNKHWQVEAKYKADLTVLSQSFLYDARHIWVNIQGIIGLVYGTEWMNGVLGHDSAFLRLYWARDKV